MNVKKGAVTAGAVAILLTGGLLVTAPAAAADSACGPGVSGVSIKRMVKNPLTGQMEMGTVTECPDVKVSSGARIVSSVTPGVGVDFRDDNGRRTGSGLSNRDQFQYLGATKTGDGEDGALVKVRQITQGVGGWGDLYEGWIPVKYTARPDIFNLG